MKSIILVIVLIAALLFAGCAGGIPQQPSLENKEPPSPSPPAMQNNTVPPVPPAENVTAPPQAEENKTVVAPPQEDTCKVEFQKDAGNVYMIMVKTESSKELSVKCPDERMAEKKGGLYFCTRLDITGPAVAYLDGTECGNATFSSSSLTQSTAGCRILLSHERITVGDNTDITVWTSTGEEQVTLTYNCGNEIKTENRSGIVNDGTNCKFDTPGTVELWAELDGELCAARTLEVFANPKDCAVFGSSYSYAYGEHIYTANVAARGYSSSDYMRYSCYDNPYQVSLREIQNTTDFITKITCRSKSGPLSQPVKVTVGEDFCGALALPQFKLE